MKPKQLYLKGLSDAGKSRFERDFGGSPRDENHEIARAHFCFKFPSDIENSRLYEGSKDWFWLIFIGLHSVW